MRKVMDDQLKLGEVDISKIELDYKSRDEIPQLLMGLRHIYVNRDHREKVFALLENAYASSKGRRGMDLWKILVLGVLRLNCNWDYDKLKEMADHHIKIREMLGHAPFVDGARYCLQTLKDNVSLLTPGLLAKLNSVVVGAGHSLVCEDAVLNGRCDSFVLETDIHFPTDSNLLWDCGRKAVVLIARLFDDMGMTEWRQWDYHLQELKKLMIRLNKISHSTSKNSEKKKAKEEQKKRACEDYLSKAFALICKVEATLGLVPDLDAVIVATKNQIMYFVEHGRRQMNLIRRRVLNDETIPHDEKVFSVFEPHSEWISKGKAGVPQELGLKVCVMEDQHGFILSHRIMQNQNDSQVATSFVGSVKAEFPNLKSCSFDKGFWSPDNKKKLEEELDLVALPKKGRLSKEDKEREGAEEFREARRQHSAVESAINALENHGLDRCPDGGLWGFERYVGLAVIGRNLQKIGAEIQKKQKEWEKRSRKIREGLARKREKLAS